MPLVCKWCGEDRLIELIQFSIRDQKVIELRIFCTVCGKETANEQETITHPPIQET